MSTRIDNIAGGYDPRAAHNWLTEAQPRGGGPQQREQEAPADQEAYVQDIARQFQRRLDADPALADDPAFQAELRRGTQNGTLGDFYIKDGKIGWEKPSWIASNWQPLAAAAAVPASGWLAGAFSGAPAAASSSSAAAVPSAAAPAASTGAGLSTAGMTPGLIGEAATPSLTSAATVPAVGQLATAPAGTMSSAGFFPSLGAALKPKAGGIISGALNAFLENRRSNKALQAQKERTALEESTLDPNRSLMFQAKDANRLDYMANGDFSSSPTSIAGRYGEAAGTAQPEFTWNPSDQTRGVSNAALSLVTQGRGRVPTMTNPANYGQAPQVRNPAPYSPPGLQRRRPPGRSPWLG